jgi:hypothetical protein
MTPKPDPYLWMSVERFSTERGVRPSETVSQVLDGGLQGMRYYDRWYVARPLVTLHYPNPDDNTVAELRLLACRLGRYLTAARGEVVIPLRSDDPDKEPTLSKLLDIHLDPPPDPATIRLAGQDWIVDSSLYADLSSAILEFDIEHDLGGLLRSMPPATEDGGASKSAQ